MDCPACGAPALPDGPDAVADSSDGPLLVTRWRCAGNHWWHMTTDVSPIPATGTECSPAEWPASEIALAIARLRISGPGQRLR
jgi:hypothetical protein